MGKLKMVGNVTVPMDKRAGFNGYVMKILQVMGCRTVEEITVAGKKYRVCAEPEPDAEGKVYFNYSVFDQTEYSTCCYDTQDCTLVCDSYIGGNAVGAAARMIMMLQEAFSSETCYCLVDGTLINLTMGARILEGILDIRLSFPHRVRAWETALFLWNAGERPRGLLGKFPIEEAIDWTDFGAYVVSMRKEYTLHEAFAGKKGEMDVSTNTWSIDAYVRAVIESLLGRDGSERVQEKLKKMLSAELPERRKMMEEDTEYGRLAEASLYLLPPYFVRAYADYTGQEFWTAWDSFGIKGYTDLEARDIEESKEREPVPLRVLHQADYDDVLLGVVDYEKLTLSEEVAEIVEEWKKFLCDETVQKDTAMKTVIKSILEESCACRYIQYLDKDVVEEFIGHSRQKECKKLILLLDHVLNKGTEWFPELPKKIAREQIVRGYRSYSLQKEIGMLINVLHSGQRDKILGAITVERGE